MHEKNKNVLLNLIGIFLVFLGIFSMVFAIVDGRPGEVLWFCYIGILIIGLGFLFKKDYFVLAQLNILILPTLIWNIDFWSLIFTGESLWGITDYFFFEGRRLVPNLISLQHIYTIPLAFLGLILLKIDKTSLNKSLVFSFLQVFVLFVFSRVLTLPEKNVNCVFGSCLPFTFDFLPYSMIWFLFVFAMILATGFGVRVLLPFQFSNKSRI